MSSSMNRINVLLSPRPLAIAAMTLTLTLAGCESTPGAAAASAATAAEAKQVIESSFSAQGQAGLDRLQQDALQKACSSPTPPPANSERALEAAEAAKIQQPPDGRYLGDWREGEKLAQNGRGMTWSDKADAPNGGNCYNCHQISEKEISFGTLGPSLHQYGKLRGVSDLASPQSAAIVRYTWDKIYDAKAGNACSVMPRFGAAHILTTKQMQDIMALLLDPKSPVNQ
jgi:sulfur-oxidizing protein SoxX